MKELFIILLIMLSFSTRVMSQDESENYKVLIRTGETPECISFKPRYNYTLDNFLKIDAINCSDIVIKIIDSYTHECIRCVFIEGGNIHFINNIPEGVFYLKIAYGYDWGKRVSGYFCFSKFHFPLNQYRIEYCSNVYTELFIEKGISVSEKGNPYENAVT